MGSRTVRGWVIVSIGFCAVGAFPALARSQEPAATMTHGIAVIGDSYSDEYQLESDERSMALNWVEILSLARGLNLGDYTTESRGEPRRGGFAHVWARSSATTQTMLQQGQHTGAAQQVQSGQVQIVIIFIGGNDYIDWLLAGESEGQPTADEITTLACQNIDQAIDTILSADPEARVILVTVPELLQLPELQALYRQGRISSERAQAARDGLNRYNAHLARWSRRQPRVVVADFAAMSRIGSILAPSTIPIGSMRLRRDAAGPEPDAAFLTDGRHAGTILQGLLAQLILNTLITQVDPPSQPLAAAEILQIDERWRRAHSSINEHLSAAALDTPPETMP